MLNAEVRQSTENLILNEQNRIDQMEEGEQKDRAVANLIKMEQQLNEFNKTDLEELKFLQNNEAQKSKRSKKEKRTENIFKGLGIAVPFGTAVICELFKIHNLNKGYAFESRDLVQTSPTFRTVWQKP